MNSCLKLGEALHVNQAVNDLLFFYKEKQDIKLLTWYGQLFGRIRVKLMLNRNFLVRFSFGDMADSFDLANSQSKKYIFLLAQSFSRRPNRWPWGRARKPWLKMPLKLIEQVWLGVQLIVY